MILVVSTSSPLVSVALFSEGVVVAEGSVEARQAASGAVATLSEAALAGAGKTLEDVERFVADVGPGSFSGVKVGVTMVKSWGWALGREVGGVSAFDLVDPDRPVALPIRRGLWFLREPGKEPVAVGQPAEGAFGYGWEGAEAYPLASRADVRAVSWVAPTELLPAYLAEPSISTPKDPSVLRGAS